MTMTVQHSLPMLLAEVTVLSVERLTPTFMRFELGGPELAEFGVDGTPLFDQRIKLVFPNAAGELASFEGADESWFGTWLARPVEERGHMRTYTVREVRGSGAETRVVVDIVLHAPPCGPGSTWAASAAVGDRLVLLGPRRGLAYGGIEFIPPVGTTRLLLVGDETAVPAIAATLADLAAGGAGLASGLAGDLVDGVKGHVFLEVPLDADVLPVTAPPGVSVNWLPRNGAEPGSVALAAVAEHLAAELAAESAALAAKLLAEPVALAPAGEDEIDPDLWETPSYSSSGEQIPEAAASADVLPGLYAWIAGESAMVTTLRRHLVRDLGVDRTQVAFMGYWRRGVAMRS